MKLGVANLALGDARLVEVLLVDVRWHDRWWTGWYLTVGRRKRAGSREAKSSACGRLEAWLQNKTDAGAEPGAEQLRGAV